MKLSREEFLTKKSFHFSWKFVTEKDLMEVFVLLYDLLVYLDKLYLYEHLQVIIRELLNNSCRAIAKRVFFEENQIDISNPVEYEENLIFFRISVLEKWDAYRETIENSRYKIDLYVNWKEDEIEILVISNTVLLDIEKQRIQNRLNSSKKYKTIIDAYREHSDSKESAGLGILMCILLLRSMGLSKESLSIESKENQTISRVFIPKHVIPPETINLIYEKVTKEVKMLPSLPESLQRIIKICNSPDMDMKKLIDEIEKNPAVSADILKLSNSVGYLNRSKPDDLSIAVKKLGSNGVLRMIYAISTIRIMNSRYSRMEEEWEHARRTSYYAERLAYENGLTKIADTIGVGALLHDIGKILLLSIEPSIFPSIMKLAKNRALENSKVVEEISLGVSHSEIGYMLARKWNFPEDLTYIIAGHHQPWNVPEEFIELTETVYLANMMTHYLKKDISFYNINFNILSKYKIFTAEELEEKVSSYETSFRKEEKLRGINA